MTFEDKDTALKDICARLSLRPPQAESLRRLARAVDAAGLKKGADEAALEAQLNAVRRLPFTDTDFAPEGEPFDWSFLSFAFALATGVGKTRLMGAIIAYLYRVKGLRNFLVIAPGTTVYEKLVADFTEGTPKYVFKGLECFATKKPVVVTGDTYQGGAGIMDNPDLFGHSIAINIFNIQKLNEPVKKEKDDKELAKVPKVRRVNERIGQSYFDYLKSCNDLVVLIDEAHHYRAEAGSATINELKPILGIEMTATPRVGNKRFNDILFEYGLVKAMKDGFVKEPAVVRRQNFRSDDYVNRQDELDRRKLTDAILVHEATKTALADYAFKKGVERVKPFILVVAPDTKYAADIETYLKSGDFYNGEYAEKVISVNYSTRGNNDAAIAQLLDIERPGNKIEIVIHVNMLSEGWDVTNLYTIVPLRAANSANLVEQTIGRGLRLPYGKRTGVTEIDTLSIVSHDKFDEIIAAARNMQIAMRERDVPTVRTVTLTTVPKVVDVVQVPDPAQKAALTAIGQMVEDDPSPKGVDLLAEATQAQIARNTTELLSSSGTTPAAETVQEGVESALRIIEDSMISIPRITISPGATTMRVESFSLDQGKINYALRDDRLVYDYVTDRRVLAVNVRPATEELSEKKIAEYVRSLVSEVSRFNDIDYDACGALVGSLCEECVKGLAAKLSPDDMANCMNHNIPALAESIRKQIMGHAVYDSDKDIVTVEDGPFVLKANTLTIDKAETPRRFDIALADGEKSRIRRMVFEGFSKCLFSLQKYDSDPEREFSVMLEREPAVLKWFKPTLSNLRLWYDQNEYTPDFIVETETEKLLCEVKAKEEVDELKVQKKKDAALKWCGVANKAVAKSGGKMWRYLLVPDTAINGSLTLAQAIADYTPPATA